MQRVLALMAAAALAVACRDGQQPLAPTAAVDNAASARLGQYQPVAIQLPSEYSAGLAVAINNQNRVVISATTVADGTRRALLWDDGVIQDLGTLGASSTAPTDINELGQVVGWSMVDGSLHAFFWDRGTMQDLGPVVTYSSDKPEFNQIRINSRGQVLGNRPGAQAFLWENGETQTLPLDFAAGLNDRGQVAGWVWRVDSAGIRRRQAAVWEAGVLTELGTLGGNESWARAISNSGWVVGGSYIDRYHNAHPFRWRDGRLEDLGASGQMSSGIAESWQAVLVNDPGQVGAKSSDLSFVWDHGLTSRLACGCGGGVAAPMAMNARGAVVGYGAWVWEDGVLQKLGDGFTRAVAINNRGTVAGYRLSEPMVWLRQ